MKMMMCFLLLLLICSSSMAQLESCVDSHAALCASLAELKAEVKNLQRENQVKQVAFSAALYAYGDGVVGPSNVKTNLVFAHVITNIGNAYNPDTGVFTAPVKGVYHFDFYISAVEEHTSAVLVKNQEQIVSAAESQSSGWMTAANGATLLLEVGDVVFVRLWENSRVNDNQNHHNTFSGHLLFTM